MRLACGAEAFLHSQVDLETATLEPDAPASGKMGGFPALQQAEELPIETPRPLL